MTVAAPSRCRCNRWPRPWPPCPARPPCWTGCTSRTSATCSPAWQRASWPSLTRRWMAGPARGPCSTFGICWSAAERCPLPTSSCANSRRGWTAAWKTWPGTRTCGCCASSGCGTSSRRCAAGPPRGPLRTTAAQYARSRFIQAQAFLTWTDALGVRPSALTQAHIDAYYASHALPPARRRPRVPGLGRRARPHPRSPGQPPPAALHRAGHHPAAPARPAAPLRHR